MTLRCESCGSTFPHFTFSGEKDTDTAGLCSASSCERNEVVLVEALPVEWNDLEGDGTAAIERRLAAHLQRSDLRVLRLLAVERAAVAAAGTSFRDFRKAYKPPSMVYTCACCATGKSRSVASRSAEDFVKSGGLVTPTGRLVVQC